MKRALIVASCFISISLAANAADGSFNNYIKQGGTVTDPLPMHFSTAQEALASLPLMNGIKDVDTSLAARGITRYSIPSERAYYLTFAEGSKFYPSVVRRRLVLKGRYLQVWTSILCGSNHGNCATLQSSFDETDHVCGVAVEGCAGYQRIGSAHDFPAPLKPFLPKILALDFSKMTTMNNIRAQLMAHQLQVAFACQDYVGGLDPYRAMKLSVMKKIDNGKEDRISALAIVENATRSIENSGANEVLAEQFEELRMTKADRKEICQAVMEDEV